MTLDYVYAYNTILNETVMTNNFLFRVRRADLKFTIEYYTIRRFRGCLCEFEIHRRNLSGFIACARSLTLVFRPDYGFGV